MLKYIFGIVVISILFILPVQAAGQQIFTRDLCKDSSDAYKEVIEVHKESGFAAAKVKFFETVTTPDSGCYALPQGGKITVTVLEDIQKTTLPDMYGRPSCVTIHRVKLENQTDPEQRFFTVLFYSGSCDKDSI